eukprot:GHVP01006698.1.p1 GENE.GHVP01006698.1~~GHVP01006698.1.p1  ORF type:complete len:301 (-),score=38.15 GHVP01006698.1:61-963(-)
MVAKSFLNKSHEIERRGTDLSRTIINGADSVERSLLLEQLKDVENGIEVPGLYMLSVTKILRRVELTIEDLCKGDEDELNRTLENAQLIYEMNLKCQIEDKLLKYPCKYSLDDPIAVDFTRSVCYKNEFGTYALLFRLPSLNWTTLNKPRSEWEDEDRCIFCKLPRGNNGLHITKGCPGLPLELEKTRRELSKFGGWRAMRLGSMDISLLYNEFHSNHVDSFVEDVLKWMQSVYQTRMNIIHERKVVPTQLAKPHVIQAKELTKETKPTRLSTESVRSNTSTKCPVKLLEFSPPCFVARN